MSSKNNYMHEEIYEGFTNRASSPKISSRHLAQHEGVLEEITRRVGPEIKLDKKSLRVFAEYRDAFEETDLGLIGIGIYVAEYAKRKSLND